MIWTVVVTHLNSPEKGIFQGHLSVKDITKQNHLLFSKVAKYTALV